MALFSDFISLNLFIRNNPIPCVLLLLYLKLCIFRLWSSRKHVRLAMGTTSDSVYGSFGNIVNYFLYDWPWKRFVLHFILLYQLFVYIFFLKFNIEITKLFTWKYTGHADGAHLTPGSPKEDLTALAKNKSYMLSLSGFTCVTFTGQ